MKITTITFTGADETADLKKMAAMSVLGYSTCDIEWGILFSPKHQGKEPRYPSYDWIRRACRVEWHSRAAHLCGHAVRDLFAGNDAWIRQWGNGFDRIQLNGFGDHPEADDHIANIADRHEEFDFILQIATEAALARAIELALKCPNILGLYDASGGQGISPIGWPPQPGSLAMGYAGGIGPDNIDKTIKDITEMAGGPTWLDMESQVRSDDGENFDLEKCERVIRSSELTTNSEQVGDLAP